MFEYVPAVTLAGVTAQVAALVATDPDGTRTAALARGSAARVAAGSGAIAATSFQHDGHNLMRYRPDAVVAAILAVDRQTGDPRPEP
jgi:hypothetical protein